MIITRQCELYNLEKDFECIDKIDLSQYKLFIDDNLLDKMAKCRNVKYLKINTYGLENLDKLGNLQKFLHFEIINNKQNVFITEKKDKCIFIIEKIPVLYIKENTIDVSKIKYITFINPKNHALDDFINYLPYTTKKIRIFIKNSGCINYTFIQPNKLNLPFNLERLEFYITNKTLYDDSNIKKFMENAKIPFGCKLRFYYL